MMPMYHHCSFCCIIVFHFYYLICVCVCVCVLAFLLLLSHFSRGFQISRFPPHPLLFILYCIIVSPYINFLSLTSFLCVYTVTCLFASLSHVLQFFIYFFLAIERILRLYDMWHFQDHLVLNISNFHCNLFLEPLVIKCAYFWFLKYAVIFYHWNLS